MEAIAEYDFEAKWPDELAFKKGNVLKVSVWMSEFLSGNIWSNPLLFFQVVNMEDDDNWFLAEFEGKEGLIPSSYIKIKKEEWVYFFSSHSN